VNWYFFFFFTSGFCSVLYELVWLRLSMAQFGVTTAMVSIVLSVFMGGLGLGSWASGKWLRADTQTSALNSHALRFYAVIELLIGVSAVVVPYELSWGRRILENLGVSSSWAYYCIAGLWVGCALVPWCALMGATIPVAMRAIGQTVPREATRSFSYLYMANVMGAVAGTILPLDREAMANALQFDSPTANSIDGTSDRDFAIEFVQALSVVALHLSRWAEELVLHSTTEFAFVKLPEQFSTGSSAMPQKKNPDALELIRGKAGRVFANATELWIAVKGLPLAYNKDMQETQQPVFAAAEQVSSMLRMATGFLAAVSLDGERMRQAASGGFMNALALAALLVRRGDPFRQAHEQVSQAVRLGLEKNCELEQLSKEDYAQCGIAADAELYRALSLDEVLAIHDVPGGTAPLRVRAALAAIKEKLSIYAGAAHAGT